VVKNYACKNISNVDNGSRDNKNKKQKTKNKKQKYNKQLQIIKKVN